MPLPPLRPPFRLPSSGTALIVLATLAALELLRLSGPVLDSVAGSHGVPAAALAAVLTYGAAAGAGPLTWWLGSREALFAALGALAVLRLVVQFPAGRGLVPVAAAVALALIALLLAVRSVLAEPAGAVRAARAVAFGIAVDVALRLPLDLWDPIWRGGLVGWGFALLLAAGLAVLGYGRYLTGRSATVPVTRELAALGPALALAGVFLASPAFLAAQGGISQTAAGMWIAAGLIAGIAAVSLPGRQAAGRLPSPPPLPASLRPYPRRVAAVLLTAAVAGLLALPGGLSGVLTLLALALLPPLLARALGSAEGRRAHATLLGLTWAGLGCGLGYVLVVLPYQAHYEMPMPVPNAVFPLLGTVLIGWAVWRPVRSDEPDRPAGPSRPARVLAPLLAAGLLFAAPPLAGAVRDAPAPLPTDTADGSYRLLSWNVHYGVDRGAEVVPDQILEVIRDSGAHVVLLQEVPRGWPIGGGTDLKTWLENRLDVTAVWAPAADRQFGNLILTSLPVTGSEAVALPQAGGTMKRSYAVADIELGNGATTRVANVHLQHGAAEETRLEQLDTLLGGHRAAPFTVLAGDFNAEPGWPEIDAVLEEGFGSAQDQAGDPRAATSPTHDPQHRIDWVFGTDQAAFADFRLIGTTASDHFPLTVTVQQR